MKIVTYRPDIGEPDPTAPPQATARNAPVGSSDPTDDPGPIPCLSCDYTPGTTGVMVGSLDPT